ncbi:hypothetical protein JW906_08925 [bacterium]|nr:hypothetical protein [bacterium]
MKNLVYDLDRLKKCVEKLREQKKRSGSFETIEALVEALFRIALHPHTPVSDTMRFLLEAHRLDNTNPRYAYHLARVTFSLGNLDAASRWLKEAVKLCPTSHRLWTHIGLLHHELNDRYKGKMEYEPDDLKKKAEKIFSQIQARENCFEKELLNFTPPTSLAVLEAEARKQGKQIDITPEKEQGQEKKTAAPEPPSSHRLSDADKCRWSGILDLRMEKRFEQKASQRQLQSVAPLLEEILGCAETRMAGITAFVIAAVQWLLIGYPVASIRRVMEKIPRDCPEAVELLDHACSLFEASLDELPGLLAESLSKDKLPPLVIALIHQNRLLWRQITFPASGSYRSAKRILEPSGRHESDENLEEKASALIQKLISAAKKLDAAPPPSISDAVPADTVHIITPAEAVEIIRSLHASCQTLKKLVDEGFILLKGDLEQKIQATAPAETIGQALKDHEAFTGILKQLQDAAGSGLARIDTLQKQIQGISPDDLDAALRPSASPETRRNAFTAMIEECQKSFHELHALSNLKKILSRIELKLAALPSKTTKPAAAISQPFSAFSEKIEAAAPQPVQPGKERDLPDSPEALLETLLNESKETTEKLAGYWKELKQMTSDRSKTLTPEQKAVALEMKTYLDSLPNQCQEALDRIGKARQSSSFTSRLERKAAEIESSVKDHLTAPGRFGKHLMKMALTAGMPGAASPAGKPETEAAEISANALSGLPGLEKAIRIVDGEIDRILRLNLSTFDRYAAEHRRAPELQMLEQSVLMQAAETMHRIGRMEQARHLWQKCLSIDRLFLPALKNIAVGGALSAKDHAQTLLSWKSYCEVLYFHAIAADHPRVSAKERAIFHRDYASAFANGFLLDDDEQNQAQEGRGRRFIDLLNSPGMLREFVAHKKAEFLNRWFEMQTPVMLLGGDRTLQKKKGAGSDGRDRAETKKAMKHESGSADMGESGKPMRKSESRDAFVRYIDRVCSELPERISRGFRNVCMSRLETAAEFCSTPEGLTLENNPKYHEDENRLVKWIESLYKLKEQFYFGFFFLAEKKGKSERQRVEWEKDIQTVDSLIILERLNEIPAVFPEEFVGSAVKGIAHKYNKRAEEIVRTLDTFIFEVCRIILISIVNDRDLKRFERIGTSLSTEKAFWQKTVAEWGKSKNEQIQDFGRFLDEPTVFYPESVLRTLNKQEPGKDEIHEAISLLEPWCSRYPGMTGPARHCAILFSKAGRSKEAIPHLERCIKQGFREEGVREAREMLSRLKVSTLMADSMEKKDFKSGRDILLKELQKSPQNIDLVHQLLSVYSQWIKTKPAEAPSLIPAMEKNIKEALQNIRGIGKGPAAEPALSPSEREQIIENKRQLTVAAAMADVGRPDTSDKCRTLIPRFKEILDLDRDNLQAVYYLASSLFRIAAEKYQNGTGDRGKQELAEAAPLFERVIRESKDSGMKDEAKKYADNIRDVMATL